jgi:hypothetical protein
MNKKGPKRDHYKEYIGLSSKWELFLKYFLGSYEHPAWDYIISESTSYNPEDGGSAFLMNVSIVPQNYTVSQPKTSIIANVISYFILGNIYTRIPHIYIYIWIYIQVLFEK